MLNNKATYPAPCTGRRAQKTGSCTATCPCRNTHRPRQSMEPETSPAAESEGCVCIMHLQERELGGKVPSSFGPTKTYRCELLLPAHNRHGQGGEEQKTKSWVGESDRSRSHGTEAALEHMLVSSREAVRAQEREGTACNGWGAPLLEAGCQARFKRLTLLQ